MKRLRKTIVVKRCLSVCGGMQCDLKKGHGGNFHGNGDANKGGRCEWGVVRRKPPTDDEVFARRGTTLKNRFKDSEKYGGSHWPSPRRFSRAKSTATTISS